jgi:DNA-binding transcriptional regulator LsrR (DeoR family)
MSKKSSVNRMALKVCRLFYQEGLNKTEIEKRLHISRFKVARLLKQAQDEGLVKIELVEPEGDLSEFEAKFEKATGLQNVVLAWDDGESPRILKEKAARIAAEYMQEILGKNNVLGIGWGTTTYELVRALPESIDKKVTVVQVSGGSTKLDSGIDSQALTVRLARKFGVSPHLLHAPAIMDSPESRKILMKESALKKIFNLYRRMDILIAGIGAFLPDRFLGSRIIEQKEMKALRQCGTVGELLYYCFDINGNFCPSETQNRIIAIPLEDIAKVPCCIGIAVGHEKAAAVLGVVRSGLINTLITDTTTARAILEIIESTEKEGGE